MKMRPRGSTSRMGIKFALNFSMWFMFEAIPLCLFLKWCVPNVMCYLLLYYLNVFVEYVYNIFSLPFTLYCFAAKHATWNNNNVKLVIEFDLYFNPFFYLSFQSNCVWWLNAWWYTHLILVEIHITHRL